MYRSSWTVGPMHSKSFSDVEFEVPRTSGFESAVMRDVIVRLVQLRMSNRGHVP